MPAPVWQSRVIVIGEDVASIAITKPASTFNGDLLVAFIATMDGTVTATPAGWTFIRVDSHASDFGAWNFYQYCYWKIAGPSEPADYTWNLTNTPRATHGVINRITGAHATTPIHNHSGSAQDDPNDATAPSITTTVGDCLLLFCCSTDGSGLVTPPNLMTERWDQVDSPVWIRFEGATQTHASAGATGTKIASHSAAHNVAQLVVVRAPVPPAHAASATASGAGSLSATAVRTTGVSATATGAGALTATGGLTYDAVASLSGLGSLSANALAWDPYGVPDAKVYIETTPDNWVEITDDLISGSTNRGRQNELDRYNTGTATLVFKNADRKYDPVNADGPLYGYLDVRHRMRVEAFQSDVVYPIFFGYIDEVSENRYLSNTMATATVKLSDFFKVLNKASINGTSFVEELSGARINEVLDLVGVDALMRDIDTGETTLQAGTYSSTLLSHAQTVAQTEFGDFFVQADGIIRFKSRNAALDEEVQGVFGDGPGEHHYNSLTPQYNDSLIRNPVSVDRNGGIKQTVEDAALTALPPTGYGVNHYTLSGTYHVDDADALAAANYILARYKLPSRRVVNLGVGPVPYAEGPTTYPLILGLELTQRIEVVERPMGVGSEIRQSSVIEGIQHEFSPGKWVTKWNVSPGFAEGDYWTLGVSELGVDTRLYF